MSERKVGRLAAEFVVIVLGVLVALAADRWNAGRASAEAESAYLARLTQEIRADSVQMETFLARVPRSLAARDSLLAALDGSITPPNVGATISAAVPFLDVSPPNAWYELEASSSLDVLSDRAVREAVSHYYRVRRPQYVLNLARAQERGRDPLFDAAFRLGVFHPTLTDDGAPITDFGEALRRGNRPSNLATFRAGPQMRELLEGAGSMRFFQAVIATQLIEAAGQALAAIEDAR